MTDADNDPTVMQAQGLLVATADHGDAALDGSVQQVLAVLRAKSSAPCVPSRSM